MRKLFFTCLFIVFILIGCSDEAYNNAIQKGLDYIASQEYQKAESAFEFALDEKKNDVKATALLAQTKNYQEALEALDQAELKIAVKKAEKVREEKEGSEALVKKAEEILSLVEGFQTTTTELTEKYESAKKQFEAEEYENANNTIKELLMADLTHSVFQPIKEDVEKLKEDIETAVIANEKAAKEKAKKEKAAQEKAEQEKAAKEKAERERAAAEKPKKEATSTAFTGEKAAQIAEQHYGGGDTGYSYDTQVAYENGKAYYTVYLYSKSMRADGGSGNLFFVQVFEDGTIVE